MFKRKNILFLVFVVAISFTGCFYEKNEDGVYFYKGYGDDIVDDFVEAAKSSDVDKMKKYVDDDKSLNNLSLDSKSSDKIENKVLDTLSNYKDECAKNLKVNIITGNKDKKTVRIKCKYINANEFVKEYLNEVKKVKNDKSLDDNAKEKKINEVYEAAKKKVDCNFEEKEVVIDLVDKNGSDIIKDINSDLYEVITANVWNSYEANK